MPFSSLQVLQFAELLELIAGYAGSEAGRDLIFELSPHSDRSGLEAALADAGEAIAYLGEASGSPGKGLSRLRFDQVRAVDAQIRVLKVEGAALDGRQILDLFHTLALAGEYRAVLTAQSQFPRLSARAHRLADLRTLARHYARTFLPDGSVSDEASVALGRIRRDIEKQKKSIHESLERFLRTHRQDGTLQEEFVTIRKIVSLCPSSPEARAALTA